jgi:hypothetical protein
MQKSSRNDLGWLGLSVAVTLPMTVISLVLSLVH